jgi:hypothetical protein
MSSFYNLSNPQGVWSNTESYVAQTLYSGVANSPIGVLCPEVKGPDGITYIATGYDSITGLPKQPTLGTAPASDSAWQAYSSAGGGGSGTVTTASVVSANGLAGTVANPTTTPAITLSTSVNGFLKGNGTAISAATTIGSGIDLALTGAQTLWTPTISVAVPGDLNIVYNQQFGYLRVIGNMAFLGFYLAATVTHTTASGIFNITGLPVISPVDEMTCTMDVFVKSTPVFTAGFTSFVAYMDGTGGSIQILPQSTNPAENPSTIGVMDITDIDSGTSFKFRGMLVFPIV